MVTGFAHTSIKQGIAKECRQLIPLRAIPSGMPALCDFSVKTDLEFDL